MDSGPRLKAYIQSQWGRDKGGMSALADRAGVRRQTLYEWFRPGSTTEPSLATLTDLAQALGVRRVDVVAAMDGVTAPKQQETPAPAWAKVLTSDILGEVRENREVMSRATTALAALGGLSDLLTDYRRELERTVQQRDGAPRAKPSTKAQGKRSRPARSTST